MSVIKLSAYFLKDQLKPEDANYPEKIKEMANNIEKNVERITTIIKGLKAFARNTQQDPFENIPVNQLVDETLELCKQRYQYTDVKVRTLKLSTDEVVVECRPTQILQVLVNLLNNAVDAVSDLDEQWVSLEAHDRGDTVEFWVTDSGKGIPPDVITKMFERFYTTKPVGKGTGLGLSVSRTILDSHRGELSVDQEAKNTRFKIEIPKSQSKRQPKNQKE